MIYISLKFPIIFLFLPLSFCFEPISSGIGLISAGALASSIYFGFQNKWPWQEKCGRKWLQFNSTDLDLKFKEKLFGQHLVNLAVSNAIKAHVRKKEHKKALVMAFHGWTGGGKNYVAKILADILYEKGSKSDFVHWYIATRDFPHLGEVKKYRGKLLREIPEHTKKCGQSLFIFDEVDKMNPGIIDALKPYLDFYEDVEGVDYRSNIFIFLSNAGGSEITKVALNLWLDGKEREDLTMKEIEPLINKGAFNEKGGLQHSELIERNLVDIYIPFLPLEKKHVRECILYELKSRGLNTDNKIIDLIDEQIIYYPPEFLLFSVSGCKKVAHKVDIYGYDNFDN